MDRNLLSNVGTEVGIAALVPTTKLVPADNDVGDNSGSAYIFAP